MERLIQDLRYGIRAMLKSRSFTAVAVVALALGIGANTAIFSVVDAALLRPLPYKNPERLVLIWHNYPSINLSQASICVPCYQEYRDMPSSFAMCSQIASGAEVSSENPRPKLCEDLTSVIVHSSFSGDS